MHTMVINRYEQTFLWSDEKNEKLLKERHIKFEVIQSYLLAGGAYFIINHHNQKQYAHQYLLIVTINNYPYCVPIVILPNKTIVFITIYPVGKRKYLFQ